MCGIAGYLDPKNQFASQALTILNKMCATIQHRGPDDNGTWLSANKRVCLGHQRLAIVDLSKHGKQPMHSADGRYHLVYNGEIYNHLALRQQLTNLGAAFFGHSDTEVILAAITAWGLDKALQQFIGMFAFALYDELDNALYLVRDRLGIKPLYYGFSSGILGFASELKALCAHPTFLEKRINQTAVTQFLQYSYIPSPLSIYENIYKLSAGHYIKFSLDKLSLSTQSKSYWCLVDKALSTHIKQKDTADLQYQLESLLDDATRIRMFADVPIGCFLSGGVDSSLIAAIMQNNSKRPINSFSIGFTEQEYNEAPYAHNIAKHLGTNHTELYVESQSALDVIPQLSNIYDEPFADASQLPTLLLSRLTRQHVTVSLSGDGGDELWGGYNRHLFAYQLWPKIKNLPRPLRKLTAMIIQTFPQKFWEESYATFAKLLPMHLQASLFGDKIYKLATLLGARNIEAAYTAMTSTFTEPKTILSPEYLSTFELDTHHFQQKLNAVENIMLLDALYYLPDDVLTKVDRASMAYGLEVRVPLLDHRLVEFSWQVPLSQKIKDGQGKYILRQILYKYVPKELIERPKMGFAIPLGAWLKGPLRNWANDLLSVQQLNQHGLFNSNEVQRIWHRHTKGLQNMEAKLWPLLMFQQWYNETTEP